MKTVFITGATGTIGSSLVPFYLNEPDTIVVLVLRAKDNIQLGQRLEELFVFWQIPSSDNRRQRVRGFSGDVTLPRMGINEPDYEWLIKNVTHAVHSAGNVKLNQSLEDAQKSAVDSLRFIYEWAEIAHVQGKLQKLDIISTVGVSGRMLGLVPEEIFTSPRVFRNTYEQAKAQAEDYLMAKPNRIPLTIHRPSMVVGESQQGKVIHFQVFYYLSESLCGRHTLGFVPDAKKVRLDIIPSDYVAKAIYISNNTQATNGKVLHLCSGPKQATLINNMQDKLRSIYSKRYGHLPSIKRIPTSWLRWVKNAKYFLSYLEEEQIFDNQKTDAFLSAHGLAVPSVDQYLEKVMTYYFDHKKMEKK